MDFSEVPITHGDLTGLVSMETGCTDQLKAEGSSQ